MTYTLAMKACLSEAPAGRPSFAQLQTLLSDLADEVASGQFLNAAGATVVRTCSLPAHSNVLIASLPSVKGGGRECGAHLLLAPAFGQMSHGVVRIKEFLHCRLAVVWPVNARLQLSHSYVAGRGGNTAESHCSRRKCGTFLLCAPRL